MHPRGGGDLIAAEITAAREKIYGKQEPKNKVELVQALLPKVFAFARAALPTQPLTSGVWKGDWSSPEKLGPIEIRDGQGTLVKGEK